MKSIFNLFYIYIYINILSFFQSQNRGDRLSSPYSLTITRSLPSLIANDADYDSVINVIVSIPSYVIRGAGTSSHYEYEVRVVAQDDSWTLLRRYRRFRELYISMRQKYGSKVIFFNILFIKLYFINQKEKDLIVCSFINPLAILHALINYKGSSNTLSTSSSFPKI